MGAQGPRHRQANKCHRPLGRTPAAACDPVPVLDADLHPFRDEAQDALVRDEVPEETD